MSQRPLVHHGSPVLPFAFAVLLAAASTPVLAEDASSGPRFGPYESAAEIEQHLAAGRIRDPTPIGVGVTRPERVTVHHDDRTVRAVWKTIDRRAQVQRFRSGRVEYDFTDSWKFEVACYELDKLLGLDLVPPTVGRRFHNRAGSLQLWLEDTITETERRESGTEPPDAQAWERQMQTVQLLLQLIWDTDRTNISNLLVDAHFRVHVIDSSRAFRTEESLPSPDQLQRFSRSLLARLESLTPERIRSSLGRWLDRDERHAILARRDLILDLARQRVRENGEAATLFP